MEKRRQVQTDFSSTPGVEEGPIWLDIFGVTGLLLLKTPFTFLGPPQALSGDPSIRRGSWLLLLKFTLDVDPIVAKEVICHVLVQVSQIPRISLDNLPAAKPVLTSMDEIGQIEAED